MYTDDIKMFTKNGKEQETLIEESTVKVLEWIFVLKNTRCLQGKKREKRNIEVHNQNTWRRRKPQIPRNIRSGYHQTNRGERKIKKGIHSYK